MITGSSHMLSPSLNQSLQTYRSQLDGQRGASAATGTPQNNETGKQGQPTVPEGPSRPEKLPESGLALDVDQVEENAQQRRDGARQAAVYAAELQQPQKLYDTYTKAASGDDTSSSSSQDPTKVYQESMDYSRRTDLLEQRGASIAGEASIAPENMPASGLLPEADQIEETAQGRRDDARQAAVFAAELKQPQELMDTYMNATSDEDETSNTSSVDPARVYQESMSYSRRADLIGAFETAAQSDPGRAGIDIVI